MKFYNIQFRLKNRMLPSSSETRTSVLITLFNNEGKSMYFFFFFTGREENSFTYRILANCWWKSKLVQESLEVNLPIF